MSTGAQDAPQSFTVLLNGSSKTCRVEPDTPLLWVLREEFELTGTKYGCGIARCGACTVLIDDVATRSCVTPIDRVTGRVTTIEGLARPDTLHAVQQAWVDENVAQCGYCQVGQVLAAVALLKNRPRPCDDDIDLAMSGNVCRCGTYPRIRRAIHRAVHLLGSTPATADPPCPPTDHRPA